ncbi:MAG: lysine--tRNA ligase [Candidatus Diapherotrites archaeon]|nr:lysine--tRNA ligase [Candidatus Diapherotrites archaeon]
MEKRKPEQEPEKNETWADEAADHVLETKRKEYVCEGMYTPSGHFHIGNARSEIFTPYAVYRALKDRGVKAKQVFVLDDFDAVRKIPAGLDVSKEEIDKIMGTPIYFAPSPIKGFDTWNHAFIDGLEESIESFGIKPEVVSAYETYKSGQFNALIKESIENAPEIVKVWNRVAGSEKAENFLPVQMICEQCGKSLYTNALSWDGKEVEYECKCGYKGKKSPFDGNAKLHWRVHWAAHWLLRDVAYESAGKDHFSKGGSVDVGQAMMREVFKKEPPYQTPTEFILVGGAKMSGSVGNVVNLKSWLEVASPETFRYLNFAYKPNSQVDFSFADNSFILLVENFERAERIYYGLETERSEKLTEKIKKNFAYSALGALPKEKPERLSYQYAAFLAQLYDHEKDFAKIQGILLESGHISRKFTESEAAESKATLKRAKFWVENFAQERFMLKVAETPAMEGLAPDTIAALKKAASHIEKAKNAEELQTAFYNTAKENNIKPAEMFKASYLALLGKEFGPKLGTLIFALGKERVKKRLEGL